MGDDLILSHIYLAKITARKYNNKGIEYDDLVQEGIIGLIKAEKRFEPDRGILFATYAIYWVKQAILECITSKSRIIRLPANVVTNKLKITKFIHCFVEDFGYEPDSSIIAKGLVMDIHHVEQVLKLQTEQMAVADYEIGITEETAAIIVEEDDNMDHVIKAIKKLGIKERFVIGMKFGLINKL